MQLSIVNKLIVSSVLLVLISAGVVGGIFYAKTTDILVDKALKRIALNVQEAGSTLQGIVNTHDEDILFLANTPSFQGLIRSRASDSGNMRDAFQYSHWESRLETVFESLLERKSGYHMVRYIDKDGYELVSVRREKSKIIRVEEAYLQNKAHRPYVKDTLKLPLGEIYLSEIDLNREYGEVVVPYQEVFRIATPIFDERNNALAGLVVITFDIGVELREIQGRVHKSGDGVIFITNDSGDYLLHPEPKKTYGFDLGNRYRLQDDIPQLATHFLSGSTSKYVTLMPDDTGNHDVVNFTKIAFDINHPQRFIAVIVTQNYAAIVEDASKALNDIVIWALLLALGGVGLAVLISIRITRPIHQMTKAVNGFSLNHTSTVNLPVDSGDEVGVLARSFYKMIQQVRQSQVRLEEMNVNLETMVEVRTNDLNQARLEAEKANKTKSEFLSRMSHELRTPMNAILGFGQLLELDIEGLNKTQRENVQEILDAGRHLLKLINEVLDLARVESGKLKVSMEEVELSDVLRQSLSLIQPLAEERYIEFFDNISDKKFIVQADIVRLKQVLLNLLSNAIKYNCEHGQIMIDSEITEDNFLRIQIIDTGKGLTKKEIDKIFTPFERFNDVDSIEGTGIGLAISKHLVELMNGAIGIESIQGKGSCFWVELELVRDV